MDDETKSKLAVMLGIFALLVGLITLWAWALFDLDAKVTTAGGFTTVIIISIAACIGDW